MFPKCSLLWCCFFALLPSIAHAEDHLPPELIPFAPIVEPVVWEVHLQSKSVRIRRAAAERLAGPGYVADGAIPALITALKDKDKIVQGSAASALSRFRSQAKKALPPLSELLRNPTCEVRAQAVEAIVEIGPEATHRPLFLKALKDEERKVRLWAAVGLLRLKHRGSEPNGPLVEAITSEDREYWLEAKTALLAAPLEVVPLLEQLLKDKQEKVRRRAVHGLEKIATIQGFPFPASTIRGLERGLKDDDQEVVRSSITALSLMGKTARESVPLVAACLKHPNPEVRWWAARELPGFGPVALVAVAALTEALDDKDEDVRKEAAHSLKRLWALVEARIKAAENR